MMDSSRTCIESDWKLFRKKIIQWQEDHMARLNKEYIAILSRQNPASRNFWDLEKRINKDKRHPGVQIDMRRSTMKYNIAILLKDNVITLEDLDGFSQDLKDAIQILLGID
ncbi:MAG: multidrug transporter [Roseburia sp.]|nr:hypothetical protein [Anaeroplasma bactoclasticum]MCM1196361.1 multidrug transporter [Roseburia sp.]MCM1557756.1 hypothetical protein [Anaeroplasma bactoclasticum]